MMSNILPVLTNNTDKQNIYQHKMCGLWMSMWTLVTGCFSYSSGRHRFEQWFTAKWSQHLGKPKTPYPLIVFDWWHWQTQKLRYKTCASYVGFSVSINISSNSSHEPSKAHHKHQNLRILDLRLWKSFVAFYLQLTSYSILLFLKNLLHLTQQANNIQNAGHIFK
jgi:hypothetical protein